MVNGINVNDELNSSQLDAHINGVNSVVTNPISNPYKNIDKNLLIDETAVSTEAINLYQKDQDIQKFKSLAMSDPEDLSHEEIVAGLFNKGGIDPFSDAAVEEISGSPKLLKDLEL